MRIRAAVLEEFGAGRFRGAGGRSRRAEVGEVLVRVVAACGVCHTDLYTASGADPTGYAPCVLGRRGGRRGGADLGEGVTMVAPGDHVITLFAPECGRCVHCLFPTARIAASRSAISKVSVSSPMGRRVCHAAASRCAISWAPRRSRNTR